ncbi:BREX-1 system adenine-specific DNA-methyltransferase PglX [Clostridium fermenticellae]|uniref:site-specific DNA-methyltransferase (adenine-specific) n=1 Tax=Clostridium fermenticellae TaxID=2068654 RepID=A0A386H1U2_9CLOT|nr:BREX-1 system adenine-specific DNA-methyltransferase PglX [Clostridium fermenticellae]AYD39515.1 BREX-1 system adenine-specific DNA-methyltransferase PglX [Clostridium fermenticellae]
MDKNKIKTFAVWARRNLIDAVENRARYIGIFIDNRGKYNELKAESVQGGFKLESVDGVFKLSYNDRKALINRINSYEDKKKGFEQVMEEVAYTWFNRFIALRYMEVNDYLPGGIRMLSSKDKEKPEPDVLTKIPEIIEELNLNGEYIYGLLDSGNTKDREEAYRHILVKQCNELGKIIPQMFEKISDYTELLLPDNLLGEGSVIRKMVEDIPEGDWKEEVEIIGWMYQYYISEKKDEVFAALKKNVKITKENIPAATQLFTPKWIVKYMVENSLGRLWLEGHPNEELQKEWKYYLEEAEQEPEVEEELNKIREEHSKLIPEDIKVLDPCMGSGHILVYAFDVLYKIYQSTGYPEREIPRRILQNNLYGLDIDDRAAQLASFALIMKARHYNRRLFREIEREHLKLNLCSIQESNGISKEAIDYFVNVDSEKRQVTGDKRQVTGDKLREDVEYLIETFKDAKEYGSILEVKEVNFEALKQRLKEIETFENQDNHQINSFEFKYREIILDKLPAIIKQAEIMSKKYEVCITNPPYMGIRNMGHKLANYLRKKYSNTKNDISIVFMDKCIEYNKTLGFTTMINIPSWMFLSSYDEMRKCLVSEIDIVNLIHLGRGIFGSDFGTVTFTMRKSRVNGYLGEYRKLFKKQGEVSKTWKIHEMFFEGLNNYEVDQNLYLKIEGTPIVYWVSKQTIETFDKGIKLEEIAQPRQGMATSDNDRFLRLWYEVDNSKIGLNYATREEANNSKLKWFPYNKGGAFRKWYGNNEYIVNWENDGEEIKCFREYKNSTLTSNMGVAGLPFIFKPNITWSKVTIGNFSVRYLPKGYLFDVSGCSIYAEQKTNIKLLALLNSKVITNLVKGISPTVNYEVGTIKKLPIYNLEHYKGKYVNECIKLAKEDWDFFETSWDFKMHPLLLVDSGKLTVDSSGNQKNINNYPLKITHLSDAFDIWKSFTNKQFNQLKSNEEELNRIFIDIYGLQDELVPEEDDTDVTIRKADRERDIKSLISYAVGCMFGRYSIDVEGLIYAGGEWNNKWRMISDKLQAASDKWQVRKVIKDDDGNIVFDKWADVTFAPDKDNVIPITEDEYFEDDIVSKFIDFIKTVYGAETLEENLDFIADSIGRKPSETARQTIRRYFIKDFYKDHLKVYQKRPIYWMFDSGKNDGFKALIYMHRYNEQTIAKVRTDYLHTLQRKYEAEIERQQLIVDSGEYTAKDKTAAKKKINRIVKQMEECREYDQVVAHLANERISIDLDDGVKVNYAKFQEIKVINSKEKEVKMNLLAKI